MAQSCWATKRQNLPVYRFVVSFVRDDLRGKVIWSAAEGPSLVGNAFGKSKVGDFQVAVAVEQKVFGLQISVDDVFGMEIFQGEGGLGSVKLGNGIGESLGVHGLASESRSRRRRRKKPNFNLHLTCAIAKTAHHPRQSP